MNIKSSNIISNGFVGYKAEHNKEFHATVGEVNESSTKTGERYRFQSDLKLKKIFQQLKQIGLVRYLSQFLCLNLLTEFFEMQKHSIGAAGGYIRNVLHIDCVMLLD